MIWTYVNKQNNVKHEYVNVHYCEFNLSRPGTLKRTLTLRTLTRGHKRAYHCEDPKESRSPRTLEGLITEDPREDATTKDPK